MGGRASDHILLVEDDPDARDEMAWVLRREGYEVVAAADGQEALEVVRRETPALILLDLMMPVMDGFEFRVRQMQDPALAGIFPAAGRLGDPLLKAGEDLVAFGQRAGRDQHAAQVCQRLARGQFVEGLMREVPVVAAEFSQ